MLVAKGSSLASLVRTARRGYRTISCPGLRARSVAASANNNKGGRDNPPSRSGARSSSSSRASSGSGGGGSVKKSRGSPASASFRAGPIEGDALPSVIASPPPSNARAQSVSYDAFFAHYRPLLEHEQVSSVFGGADRYSSRWRMRRTGRTDEERFTRIVDALSHRGGVADFEGSSTSASGDAPPQATTPSDRVAGLRAELETKDLENLVDESELTIVGEPKGPDPRWPKEVALWLAEHGRAYEPPSFGHSSTSSKAPVADSRHTPLLLSHALLQTQLPSAFKWDQVEAMMDAAAAQTPSPTEDPWSLEDLKAALRTVPDVPKRRQIGVDEEGNPIYEVLMDSVRRKRRKKITKHKYKKRRKAQRAMRKRLGK